MTDQYYNVERLIQALREPRIVFSAHWDTFRLPYGDPQDEAIKALRSFGEKLKKVYPKSTFRVLKHFETLRLGFLPGDGPKAR